MSSAKKSKLREFPPHMQKYWLRISSRDTWSCEYVYEHNAVAIWKHGMRVQKDKTAGEIAALSGVVNNLQTKVDALLVFVEESKRKCTGCGGTGRVPVGEIHGLMKVPGTQSCNACRDIRELINLVKAAS